MRKKALYFVQCAAVVATLATFTACKTTDRVGANRVDRAAIAASIRQESPGNYFIGRRYYKRDYHFWGYVRKPGQLWSSAKMVMVNENKKLIPDRAGGKMGTDNDYEYILEGYFSGDTVYEPASNGFYPEFVLTGYTLRSANPPNIFTDLGATNPARRIISKPIP